MSACRSMSCKLPLLCWFICCERAWPALPALTKLPFERGNSFDKVAMLALSSSWNAGVKCCAQFLPAFFASGAALAKASTKSLAEPLLTILRLLTTSSISEAVTGPASIKRTEKRGYSNSLSR